MKIKDASNSIIKKNKKEEYRVTVKKLESLISIIFFLRFVEEYRIGDTDCFHELYDLSCSHKRGIQFSTDARGKKKRKNGKTEKKKKKKKKREEGKLLAMMEGEAKNPC